jgi:hypothetical protein
MTLQVALTIIAMLFAWHLFAGWMKGWKDEDDK